MLYFAIGVLLSIIWMVAIIIAEGRFENFKVKDDFILFNIICLVFLWPTTIIYWIKNRSDFPRNEEELKDYFKEELE